MYSMKYKSTKRLSAKPLDIIVRCVNCDLIADTDDIKFGCGRCAGYDCGGRYTPSNWMKIFKEGGWYKDE